MWRVLAVVAVLWPSHLSGPLDGAPLDRLPAAILLGLLVPILAWCDPAFLRRAVVRAAIVAILLIKGVAAVAVQQEGWCVTFVPPRPMVRESTGKPHAWDVRADWLGDDPACSAIMTRSYRDTFELPAWFFNLPPPDEAVVREGFDPGQIPIRVSGTGYLTVGAKGAFELLTTAPMEVEMRADGVPIAAIEPGRHRIELPRGTHAIEFSGTMLGKLWRIVPTWEGVEMGSLRFPQATLAPPSSLDRVVRPAANWLLAILVAAFVTAWLISAIVRLRAPSLALWIGAASAAIVIVSVYLPAQAAWYTAAAAAIPLAMPMRRRLMSTRTAFLLVALPLLVLIAATHAQEVGRWTLYGIGNDNFQFQRFSYRIFMQHYWLEGGQPTFWNQPLYRWIAGALHMVFGDSSVGQAYWDAGAVAIIVLFAYAIVRPFAGFTWALAASAAALAMFLLGPAREFIGFGLSEISSAGFVYLAAFFALRNRAPRDAVIAGVLVTLGFYTRLNNFPMAAAVAAFAVPLTVASGDLWRPRGWLPLVRWRVVAGVAGALAAGLLLFAWRTWHYTGVFSVFHGTQREYLAVWKDGMSFQQGMIAMGSSLMMVLTGQDPPRLVWHSAPLLIAALISVAAILRVPVVAAAPLPVVLFFLAGCAGAFVSRGWAYEGRFSMHLYGAAAALCAWTMAAVVRRTRDARRSAIA